MPLPQMAMLLTKKFQAPFPKMQGKWNLYHLQSSYLLEIILQFHGTNTFLPPTIYTPAGSPLVAFAALTLLFTTVPNKV